MILVYFTVQASTVSSTEAAPTKPVTLPRTSSLVKQHIPSDPKSSLPEVNGKVMYKCEHNVNMRACLVLLFTVTVYY